jgi:cell division septation protein DedD
MIPKETVMGLARCAAVLMLLVPAALAGQHARASDSVFAQAQKLVAEGRGEEGRALVERTLASAQAGSAEYAEALYWRGVMAPTAAEAERDLRRVIVEFPLATIADDALLRLAQLEIARGDRARATEHLERLLIEHPTSEVRPRAQLTMARMQLDAGQAATGCATLRNASSTVGATEIELRNQIAYLQQRCTGAVTDTRVAETQTSRGDVAPSTPRQAAGIVDTATATPPVSAPPATIETAPTRRAAPADTKPAAAPPPAAKPAATPPSSGSAGYSVQVGAFSTRAQADQVQQALAKRGYQVRVVPGPRNLFRVRVGRYSDHPSAVAAQGRMKQSGVNGMVVEAEPR